eukprot:jgi/Botrbrau1/16990/Bobra.49_2s0049.1
MKVVEDRKVEEQAGGLIQKSLETTQTYTQKMFLALHGFRDDWFLHNSFNRWVTSTHTMRRKKELVRIAIHHLYIALGSRAMRAWRQRALYGRMSKAAVLLWSGHTCHHVLLSWKRRVQELKFARSRTEQAILWWASKSGARAFLAWRNAACILKDREIAKQQADVVHNGLLVRKALLAWTDYLLFKRQQMVRELLAMQKLARMRLCISFDGWRSVAHAIADLHKRVADLAARSGSERRRQILQMWRALMEERKGLARDAVLLMSGRYLGKPFQLWRQHVRRTLLLHEAGRVALALHIGRSTLKVFKEWKAWSTQSRFHKNCLAQCMTVRAATTLEHTFSCWKLVASRRAYQQRVLAKSLSKVRTSLASRALAGWRGAATNKRQLRSKFEMLAMVWAAWQGALEIRSERQESMTKALISWRARQVSTAFATWRCTALDLLQERHMLRKAVGKCYHLTMSKAFAGLQWSADHQKYKRGRMAVAITTWRLNKLRASMDEWRSVTQVRMNRRARLESAIRSLRLRNLQAPFVTWRHHCIVRRETKTKVLRIVQSRNRRDLLACFNPWRDWASNKCRTRAIGMSAMSRIRHKQMSLAFDEWFVRNGKARNLGKARNFLMQRLLATGWTAFVRHHELVLLERATLKMTTGLMSRAWQSWRDFVGLRREQNEKVRAVLKMCWGSRARRALMAWQAHVFLRKCFKLGVTRHKRHLILEVLRQWKDVARGLADLELKERALRCLNNAASLRQLLTTWRHITKADQTYKRCLIYRGLLSWKAQLAYRKLWRDKLASVSRILLFGVTGRTFVAWKVFTQAAGMRRVVYIAKQAAIREALRQGDQIAKMRRMELQRVCLSAWRGRTHQMSRVAAMLRSRASGCLDSTWRAWQKYCQRKVVLRECQEEATMLSRLYCQQRSFAAWRRHLSVVKDTLAEKFAAVAELAFTSLTGVTLFKHNQHLSFNLLVKLRCWPCKPSHLLVAKFL